MNALNLRFAGMAFAASFGLASLTILAMTAPAHAASEPTRLVRVYDLDLRKSDGQAVLRDRIRRAAQRLCVDRANRALTIYKHGRACIDATIAAAQPQIRHVIASDLATTSLVQR